MKYKAYPDYKKSEMDWIETVPSHWNVEKSKYIFKKMERPIREDDGVVTAFRDGVVTLRSNRRTDGFTFSVKEIGYQGVRKGDLVIHEMDGFAGAIGVSDSDGKCSPIYSLCLPKIPTNNYYYAYLLRQMAYSGFITALAKGIRERSTDFRFQTFKELLLPIPPFEEQKLIASFLDQEISKLDQTIEKYERLIELLKEKRIALISHVVTKGLDENVEMKDSGVEWIGEIPVHWEVSRLKFIISENLKYGINEPAVEENKDDIRYIRITDFGKMGEIRDDTFKSLPINKAKDFLLKEGDILFARSGATVGKTFLYDSYSGNACYAGYLIKATLKKNNDPKFIYFFTKSDYYNSWLNSTFIKSTIENVSAEKYSNLMIPIPPKSEQIDLVSFIEDGTNQIDIIITKITTQISLLKEYKTSLISQAVTGKIDVRQEAKL